MMPAENCQQNIDRCLEQIMTGRPHPEFDPYKNLDVVRNFELTLMGYADWVAEKALCEVKHDASRESA